MAYIQNLIFEGTCPSDPEFDHIPGRAIAVLLIEELKIKGWQTAEAQGYAYGWTIECVQGNAQMIVTFSSGNNQLWFLQIYEIYDPGFIGRLMNKKASANSADIFRLATAVHEIISVAGPYKNLKWSGRDFPFPPGVWDERDYSDRPREEP